MKSKTPLKWYWTPCQNLFGTTISWVENIDRSTNPGERGPQHQSIQVRLDLEKVN